MIPPGTSLVSIHIMNALSLTLQGKVSVYAEGERGKGVLMKQWGKGMADGGGNSVFLNRT